jgi:NAD(P)H-hydrate epimerase
LATPTSAGRWLSRDQVRETDRITIEEYGLPGCVLMENAGRAVAEFLLAEHPPGLPVTILCGRGGNGGDGFVLARWLRNRGLPIHIILADPAAPSGGGDYDPGRLIPDARIHYQVLRKSGVPVRCLLRCADPQEAAAELSTHLKSVGGRVVDALYGTGLTRPLDGLPAALVETVNQSGLPVLAVDLPSGLDCDSGEALGPTIRAAQTVTFIALKQGFLKSESKRFTGEVHVVDIGVPAEVPDRFFALNSQVVR